MQFTRSVTLISLLGLAFATPLELQARQNGVTCQTSDGSPDTGDVTNVINELGGRGGQCANGNGEASHCTTLVSHGTAAISLCGAVDDGFPCADIASYANQIQQTCLSNGRSGGTFTIDAGHAVEVIHSE